MEIMINPIGYKEIVVPVAGTTALLANKMKDRNVKELREKLLGSIEPSGRVGREPMNPEQDMIESIHWIDTEKKIPGFPSSGIRKAMIFVGGRVYKKKMTELRNYFHIPIPLIEIKGSEPKIYERVVWIQGKASIAYMAIFEEWEMDIPISHLASIKSDVFFNLIAAVGTIVGIGPNRLENNGTFGQFVLRNK